MKHYLKTTAARAALAAASLWAVAGVAQAQQADEPTQIDEVVITASKREGTVQKTPQSIAVLDGELQRDRGQQRLEDLQTSVPNVSFTNTSNSSQLYIRGIGNTFINAGGDPGVAFYQDSAYVSDQRTTNTSMFDTRRVEILRGPQGALYGRNAVGGALNVISARPTDSFEGRVDALAGDYGRLESEGYVSGPLGEGPLEGRLSYQVRKLEGFTRNQLASRPGAPDHLDDANSYALRGQLASDLPGGGRLNLLVSHYNEDQAGPALAIVSTPGFVYPAEALYGETPTNKPRSIKATLGSTDLKVSTVNLNYVQPIGDATLTLVANYRDGEQGFLNDCDGVEAQACRYATDTDSRDWYAEAYISSSSEGRFRWVVGATYGAFDQFQVVDVQWQTLLAYLAPGVPTNVPFAIHYTGGGDLEARSIAAYADLRFQFNDVWAVSGQIRYSRTTKDVIEFQTIPSFGVNVTGFRNDLENSHTPFKLAVEGQLTSDILVYASYATANKDGAINIGALQTTPVRPEEVRSWEAGIKSSFFERRLQVNAALFHSQYDDLQIAQVIGTVAALANAPKASVQGGELEIVAAPVEGLRLGASLGYLDGQFDEFSNSPTIPGLVPGPLTDLSGNQLPNISKWTVNLDAQYRFSPVDGFEATLGAQYSWRSRIYFNEFNDPTNAEDSGGVLNLTAAFAPDDGRWRVYGYLNNATDRTYQIGSTIYSGLLGGEKAVNYAPPRNFGVGLAFTF